MKLDATAYFQCAKNDVKVFNNTLEPDILQKHICFYAGNKTRVLGIWITLPPIGTMFFIQEYNLLFSIPKKNVIFNIHHLLFQNQ